MGMLRTAELEMAETISEEDVSTFLDDASRAIHMTHHIVFKASSGAAIFGRDMLQWSTTNCTLGGGIDFWLDCAQGSRGGV